MTIRRTSGARLRAFYVIPGLALALSLADRALADPSDLCLTAARQAAADTGVPLSVLIAVTQTETGRRRDGQTRPWPWTVNTEGDGQWFESQSAAFDDARANLAAGKTSFDVGCFQINYRWHAANFASLEAMFDPATNARYAATFLLQLYEEKGDWSAAAGAFHSRTEEYATRYRTTFDRFRADAQSNGVDEGLLMADARDPRESAAPRVNTFPLLKTGNGQSALGSLVQLGSGG